jgi:hypothetical protein
LPVEGLTCEADNILSEQQSLNLLFLKTIVQLQLLNNISETEILLWILVGEDLEGVIPTSWHYSQETGKCVRNRDGR